MSPSTALPDTMQALVAEAPNRFAVKQMPLPRPAEGEVLIRIAHSTICGSDVKLLRGRMEDVSFPLVPGHEWCGVVAAAPDGLRHLEGQRVVADILQGCGGCRYCRRGEANLCPDLVEPGLSTHGSFAEFLTVPAANLFPLPPTLPFPLACLVEPLAVVLYALRRVPVTDGETVLLLGAGGIGQLLSLAARQRGAGCILVADPHPERRDAARRLGATEVLPPEQHELERFFDANPSLRPDVVFDVAGRGEAVRTAAEVVRPGGRIGLLGYAGTEQVALPASIFMRKLLDVRGVLSPTGTWRQAIEMLAERAIDPSPLLTHERPLEDFAQAFALTEGRWDGALRVVVRSEAGA